MLRYSQTEKSPSKILTIQSAMAQTSAATGTQCSGILPNSDGLKVATMAMSDGTLKAMDRRAVSRPSFHILRYSR